MSKRLTQNQAAVLVRAGMDIKATAKNVRPVTGNALQRRGYGNYDPVYRKFYLNGAGLQYSQTGKQIGD